MLLITAALLAAVDVVVLTTGIDARDSTLWRWQPGAAPVALTTLDHAPGAAPVGLVVGRSEDRVAVLTRRSESLVSAELVAVSLASGQVLVIAGGVDPLQAPRWHQHRLAFVRVLDEGALRYDIVSSSLDGRDQEVLAHAEGYLVPALGEGDDPLRFVLIDGQGHHQLAAVHEGVLVTEQELGSGLMRSPVAHGALGKAHWAIERVEGSVGIIVVDGAAKDRVIAGSSLRPFRGGHIYAAGKGGIVRSDRQLMHAKNPVVGVARPVASFDNGDVIIELDRGWSEPRQLWWLPVKGAARAFPIPSGSVATVLTAVQP
jgi:hypothetical protein